MKTVDIVLLVILLFGAYKGYKTGLLMELVTLLALIIGIIGAFKLLHNGVEFLSKHLEVSDTVLPFISFILIFIIIVILVNILGKSLKKILDMTLLGSFDNLVGSIVGILKWAFGISVIFWLLNSFNLGFPASVTDGAYLYPVVQAFAPKVIDWLSVIFPVLEGFVEGIKEMI